MAFSGAIVDDTKNLSAIPKARVRVLPAKAASRDQRCEEIRRIVIENALECFSASGFGGTSTRIIAARAGVTHALVLYHFKSKQKLWTAALESALSEYLTKIDAMFKCSSEISARDALALFIQSVLELPSSMPQIYRMIAIESSENSPRLNWMIDRFLHTHFDCVIELIKRGQEEGAVRLCDPARLYYQIIRASNAPFMLSAEYKVCAGRNARSESEILEHTAFIQALTFR